MFTRCGAYEEALSSFQKSGNWRQVFCMASLLRHTDEQVISLARSVAGINSLCVPFHENAKPVIFLMITVRVIETQSISKLYRQNVLSKSTFYDHCLFKNVIGAVELLCMGTCERCFRRAFFLSNRRRFNEIVVYQKLFCFLTPVASSNYHDHVDGNGKIIGSFRNGDTTATQTSELAKQQLCT